MKPGLIVASESERPFRELEALVDVAPDIFARRYTPDCCLNVTRVILDALGKFKIRGTPLAVFAMAVNKVFSDLLDAAGRFPRKEEFEREWMPKGAYSVGIKVDDAIRPGVSWPGHLVVLARGWLIDGAVGQFSRPTRGIDLPAVIALPYPAGFETGAADFPPLVSDEGALLSYRALPDRRDFINTPGFARSPQNVEATRELVEEMRAWLKGRKGRET